MAWTSKKVAVWIFSIILVLIELNLPRLALVLSTKHALQLHQGMVFLLIALSVASGIAEAVAAFTSWVVPMSRKRVTTLERLTSNSFTVIGFILLRSVSLVPSVDMLNTSDCNCSIVLFLFKE